jgi:hypothetical protein
MSRPIQRIADVAEEQWGLVTRQQAEQAGVPWPTLSRLAKDQILERVDRGVYRIRGADPPDHLSLRAAWLQLDPTVPAWKRLDEPDVAVVSHTSAAALYGVGDLRPDIHEFTLPVRRQSRRKDIRLHRGTFGDADVLVLHGLPTTIAGQMIGDLLADHVDPVGVAQIVDQVLTHVYDYPSSVAERLAPYATRFGLRPGDGVGVLDHMLRLAGSRERELLIAEAKRPAR